MTLEKALKNNLLRPTSGHEKSYEFQVNLHFTERYASACGMGPNGSVIAVFGRGLSGLLTRLRKKTGLQLQQIKLSFQPE